MTKLKFKLSKKNTFIKFFTLMSANKQKSTKYKTSLSLGMFNPKLNLFLFKYVALIHLSKKGYIYSKQSPLLLFYYLKQQLSKYSY